MKKIAIAAIAAALTATSFASVAEAAPNWRHRGWHGGWHHGWNNRGWHGGWHHRGWRSGWYGPFWGGPIWGGPRIVIGGPAYYGDYCFVKKVRRHDSDDNVYIKRVRVCR